MINESTGRIYTRGLKNNQHVVTELRKLVGATVESVGALTYSELHSAHGFTLTFDTGQKLTLRMSEGRATVEVEDSE